VNLNRIMESVAPTSDPNEEDFDVIVAEEIQVLA
jgi:hypothetical protein